jgi:hypothetical protein
MIVRSLEVKDAAMVAEMEAAFFPVYQRAGVARIRQLILVNKLLGSGIALGLFKDAELAGYILAFLTGFRGRADAKHEKVIYVSNFVVLPAYLRYAGKLLETGISNARRVLPSRPALLYSTRYYKDKWTGRQDFIRRQGYRLAWCRPRRFAGFEQDMFLLRFEPINTAIHTKQDRFAYPVFSHMIYHMFEFNRLVSKKLTRGL